jgi:SAM-dependent methyltransferase
MRCVSGEIHRKKVLSFLPPGGRMLEWGSGGSTVWFAKHLPANARLTTIEHDPAWHATVSERLRAEGLDAHDAVRLRLVPATGPVGRNATEEEEDASALSAYIAAVADQRFDVILVDGVARAACMAAARELLNPGGVLLLHDSQRSWYDEAKQLYRAWGVVGSCPDYPTPVLWYGGVQDRAPATSPAALPLIVSYFTEHTPYEDEARRMMASCDRLGLEYDVAALPAGDSWESNCARKAQRCLDAWRQHRRPILWLDADAVALAPPTLLAGCTADFAIHRWNDWAFASGTVFFNQTPLAEQLLERWVERCRSNPRVWDQVSLDLAWEELTARTPLETLWLPRSYYQVFDAEREPGTDVVFRHDQASRRLKRAVSNGVTSTAIPAPSEAVFRARVASRPRRSLLPAPDSADFARELADERALDTKVQGAVANGRGSWHEGWWTANAAGTTTHEETAHVDGETCLREMAMEIERAANVMLEERMAGIAARLQRRSEPFAIYGAGTVGQALLRVLRGVGLSPLCFVETDASRRGTRVLDVPIWSIPDARAANCHLYALGSFASAGPMIAAIETEYAGSPFRFEVLVPQGPAPQLPRVPAPVVARLASPNGAHHIADHTSLTTLAPALPSAEQWQQERRYWRERLRDIYASRYGIASFHSLQDSAAMVPAADLVALIQSPHMATPDGFWGSSFRGACLYLDELHDHGFDPRRMTSVLEFGVGLGRLLVNYLPFNVPLFGCDVTQPVAARTATLFGGRATIVPTGIEPPLPYADGQFDFVYANSVFTHIPHARQAAWIAELARITRPGGCVIATAIDLNVHYGGQAMQLDALLRPRGWFELEPDAGVHMGFLATDATLRALWSEAFTVREIRHHFNEQLHLVCTK